jgi:serine/threonine-protein kinase
MSPEQARGRSADKRADIWAFGCVLYECLAGKRAFQGETISDMLALVLKSEPDWSGLPANTPPNIRTLVRRCLQKNKKNRLHDIADARIEIEEAGTTSAAEYAPSQRFPLGWVLAIGAVLFIAGFLVRPLIWQSQKSTPVSGPAASVIKLKPGYGLDGKRQLLEYNWPSLRAMTISRDGRFIVYCAVDDAAGEDVKPLLFMRRIDELEANPITGTEGGVAPFLSPDDRWIGFWAEGKLKKVFTDGGVAQDLCEAGEYGAGWGVNNRIVFADINKGLSTVDASGGEPESLTSPDESRKENDHRFPSYLPYDQGILFTVMQSTTDQHPRVALYIDKTGEWNYLLEDASDAHYLPTGHIVFLRQGMLMAVPFSLRGLKLAGEAVPVKPNVMQSLSLTGHNTTAGQFTISDSGCLIYASGGVVPSWKNTLAWVDHKGNDIPAVSREFQHFSPRLAPDGQKIVFQTIYTSDQIWIHDVQRDISSSFFSEYRSGSPLWTPDGKKIIFVRREPDGSSSIFAKVVDGAVRAEELILSVPSGHRYTISSISPDGNRLALVDSFKENRDILIYDFTNKSISSFRVTQYREEYPDFSPDGRWLVYTSDHEGRSEVYVAPFSSRSGEVKVSRDGGREPGWARSGKQLFYRFLEEMWVVDVQSETNFSAGVPRLLFKSMRFGGGGPRRCWDISLDDKRFLMVKREERPLNPVTEIILIQNWFEELNRLVPTKR